MKPIPKKIDERIQKNTVNNLQEDSSIVETSTMPKELVYKRILGNLEWAMEEYQKTQLC